MPVDSTIRSAIEKAVAKAGQPKQVASRIIAWYEGLATGNETFEDRTRVITQVETILDALEVGGQRNGGE